MRIVVKRRRAGGANWAGLAGLFAAFPAQARHNNAEPWAIERQTVRPDPAAHAR
jgi:hypothetical protein